MTDTSFGAALARLWPRAAQDLRDGIERTAPAVFAKYGFTPLVIAIFMGEISHECGAGRELVENGNYSPEGIVRTWPSRFHSLAEAMPYAHNAEKLFNKVYGGRMGNTRPGDGYLFRGRGGTNTTGHDGYFKLAQKTALDLLNDPDLVNRPDLFLECAVIDFVLCGCLPFALRDDSRGVCLHLNGGLIGLAQREDWIRRWKSALMAEHGAEAVFPTPAPRPDGQLQFGDKGGAVKGLQRHLADKGYSCGKDDGEFHEGTRGAVAKLQLDHGLPSTGIADQATCDALERSAGAPVGEARATATVKDLRDSGSRTIESTDRLSPIGWLKTIAGLGTAGGAVANETGTLDTVQDGIDKAHQAASIFDQLKPALKWIFGSPFALPIGIVLAGFGIVLLLELRKIRRARLEDHRSGANMGR